VPPSSVLLLEVYENDDNKYVKVTLNDYKVDIYGCDNIEHCPLEYLITVIRSRDLYLG
jgi:hypothetical protein